MKMHKIISLASEFIEGYSDKDIQIKLAVLEFVDSLVEINKEIKDRKLTKRIKEFEAN